jgi:hypothetical protein
MTSFAPIGRPLSRPNDTSTTDMHPGVPVRRFSSRGSQLSKVLSRDPDLDLNLPYQTLSANANLAEYTVEEPSGAIPGPVAPDGGRYKLVTFKPNDPENPKNWSKAFKWYCTVREALAIERK